MTEADDGGSVSLIDLLLGGDLTGESVSESRSSRRPSFPEIGDDVWPVSKSSLQQHLHTLAGSAHPDLHNNSVGFANTGQIARQELRKQMVVSAFPDFPKAKIPIRVSGGLTVLTPISPTNSYFRIVDSVDSGIVSFRPQSCLPVFVPGPDCCTCCVCARLNCLRLAVGFRCSQKVQCCLAHPGLCRHRDALVYDVALGIAALLHSSLSKSKLPYGEFVILEAGLGPGVAPKVSLTLCVACHRHRDPPVTIFAEGFRDGDRLVVAESSGKFKFLTSYAVAALLAPWPSRAIRRPVCENIAEEPRAVRVSSLSDPVLLEEFARPTADAGAPHEELAAPPLNDNSDLLSLVADTLAPRIVPGAFPLTRAVSEQCSSFRTHSRSSLSLSLSVSLCLFLSFPLSLCLSLRLSALCVPF